MTVFPSVSVVYTTVRPALLVVVTNTVKVPVGTDAAGSVCATRSHVELATAELKVYVVKRPSSLIVTTLMTPKPPPPSSGAVLFLLLLTEVVGEHTAAEVVVVEFS